MIGLRSFKPAFDDRRIEFVLAGMKQIMIEGQMYLGMWTEKVEKLTASIHGTDEAVFVTSGEAALDILVAYWKDEGYDVAYVQALGFPSVVNALLRHGYKVVAVDVDEKSYFMDLGHLDRMISKYGDGVVVPIHLFGHFLGELGEYNAVVHDVCEAVGVARFSSEDGAVSFHATKVIHGGIGGAIVTNSCNVSEFARVYRNAGMVSRRFVVSGASYVGGEVNALMVYSQLMNYGEYIRGYLSNAEIYAELVSEAGLNLLEIEGSSGYNGYMVPLLLPENVSSADVRRELYERYGIETLYTPAVAWLDEDAYMGKVVVDGIDLERLRRLMYNHILLPTYYDIDVRDMMYVVDAVKEVVSRYEDTHGARR